jgi:anti-anti-sigma factor
VEILTDGPTLVLRGDFDVRSTGEVRRVLYELLAVYDADVVVDVREVDTIDHTALKVLVVATREAGRRGGHLRLRGCPPHVRRMLHVSRLARLVEVERTAVPA